MKSLVILVCLTTISFFASAQKSAPNSAEEDSKPNFTVPMTNTWLDRYEKRQSKMIQILGLSTTQKRSLDTLNDRYVTQKAILHEDKSLSLRARISKNEVLRRERDSKFRSLLSPEQVAKWNELRKTQKKKTFRKK